MTNDFSIELSNTGDTALVKTPYDSRFVALIKSKIGGARWNASEKAWSVPATTIDNVRTIMCDVYGRDDRPVDKGQLVTVQMDFACYDEAQRNDVKYFGKVIAHARGRDTGAVPGSDAVFIKGRPISAGSRNHWTSAVNEGSCVILHNVPLSIYMRDKDSLPEGITATVMQENTSDNEASSAPAPAESTFAFDSTFDNPCRVQAARIIDIFEDLLDKHNITWPNSEREEAQAEGDDSAAVLYGTEYDELLDAVHIAVEDEYRRGLRAAAAAKNRCKDCASLVEDEDGEWFCDEAQKKIADVGTCPEGLVL